MRIGQRMLRTFRCTTIPVQKISEIYLIERRKYAVRQQLNLFLFLQIARHLWSWLVGLALVSVIYLVKLISVTVIKTPALPHNHIPIHHTPSIHRQFISKQCPTKAARILNGESSLGAQLDSMLGSPSLSNRCRIMLMWSRFPNQNQVIDPSNPC